MTTATTPKVVTRARVHRRGNYGGAPNIGPRQLQAPVGALLPWRDGFDVGKLKDYLGKTEVAEDAITPCRFACGCEFVDDAQREGHEREHEERVVELEAQLPALGESASRADERAEALPEKYRTSTLPRVAVDDLVRRARQDAEGCRERAVQLQAELDALLATTT